MHVVNLHGWLKTLVDQDKTDESEQRATILRYLAARPHAADTVDGVTNWWLTRQRYHDTYEVIEKVLEGLVVEGRLVKTTLPDKKILYTCAPT